VLPLPGSDFGYEALFAVDAPIQALTAQAAAYAGRGAAHLTLPQDVIAAMADRGVVSAETLKPRPELAASAADIDEMARWIDQADTVVIMSGDGCHGAADELHALSDRLKAPLIHSVRRSPPVAELAQRDAVFILDTGLNTLWSPNWIRQIGLQRIIGSFNNAAVGTALAQANGIQALDRSRQVVALCGDGGFNMLMSEFLTAVHHRLPVKVVVYNNSAFGLIPLEAEAVSLPPYREGIEFPNPDFAALARACGGHALRATKPGELHAEINAALKVDGPAIVDCVVAADEMPNLPHIDLETIGHYAVAKIKEALLGVTGP
jgi:thiamine pyrophosphate-dependent acetolactate synthase large subunit-like protein